MGLRNNFTKETQELFKGNFADWEDGVNDADCLHHILGRVAESPYNSAPLSNFRNHWPEWRTSHNLPPIHSYDVQRKYLLKTKKFLDGINYVPTENDLNFLKKYDRYYKKINTRKEETTQELGF